jgi:hypothetical protein
VVPKTAEVIRKTQKHYRIWTKRYHNEYGLGVIQSEDGEQKNARLTIPLPGNCQNNGKLR